MDGLERFSKTIPQNENMNKYEPDGVKKNCEDHPGTSVDGLHSFFDTIRFIFFDIYILWNDLRKPFKTISDANP